MAALDMERLAAARSALDPERRAWRHDVLISHIVGFVASGGALSFDQIFQTVRSRWAGSISEEIVRQALATAEEARLLIPQGRETHQWVASETARRDLEEDRRWVAQVRAEFQTDFSFRLRSCCDREIAEERIPKLTDQMLAALAAGAARSYELAADPLGTEGMHPFRFEAGRMTRYIRDNVNPKSVARAMIEVMADVLSPNDPFGNQLLQFLMTANILDGLLARADVPGQKLLQGTRILLDMNFLLYTVSEDASKRRIFEALLQEADSCGVEVVVAEHTLDEWERFWDSADEDVQRLSDPDLEVLSSGGWVLVGHPLIRAYAHARSVDPSINWPRFSRGRAIRRKLVDRGVNVRTHGNNRDEDKELVGIIKKRLLELSADPDERGHRSLLGATADAHSCAMVARWREGSNPLPGGWLVAEEYLTGRVYKEVRGDDPLPLTLSPDAFLLYASSMRGEDPASVNQLARAMTDAALQRTFLSVAASYTPEEAVRLAKRLAETAGGDGERSDARDLFEADLLRLLDEAEDTESGGALTVERRAMDVTALRSYRSDARATRRAEEADRVRERAEDRAALAESGLDAERRRSTTAEERLEQQTRLTWAVGASLVGLLVGAVLGLTGLVSGNWRWILVVGVGYLIYSAFEYWDSGTRLRALALKTVGVLITMALALLLDRAVPPDFLDSGPNPQPSESTQAPSHGRAAGRSLELQSFQQPSFASREWSVRKRPS